VVNMVQHLTKCKIYNARITARLFHCNSQFGPEVLQEMAEE